MSGRRRAVVVVIAGTNRPYGDGRHEALTWDDKLSWDDFLAYELAGCDIFQRGQEIQYETCRQEWQKSG